MISILLTAASQPGLFAKRCSYVYHSPNLTQYVIKQAYP